MFGPAYNWGAIRTGPKYESLWDSTPRWHHKSLYKRAASAVSYMYGDQSAQKRHARKCSPAKPISKFRQSQLVLVKICDLPRSVRVSLALDVRDQVIGALVRSAELAHLAGVQVDVFGNCRHAALTESGLIGIRQEHFKRRPIALDVIVHGQNASGCHGVRVADEYAQARIARIERVHAS